VTGKHIYIYFIYIYIYIYYTFVKLTRWRWRKDKLIIQADGRVLFEMGGSVVHTLLFIWRGAHTADVYIG